MKKIRVSFIWILVACIFELTTGCGTKEDDQFPTIKVTEPSPDIVYENGDTIKFSAAFSDDNRITYAAIQLVDEDNKPVLPAITYYPSENPITLQGDYLIDDPLLPGGIYHLRFRVSDGANVTNYFLKLQIQESERQFLYPVIITQPDPGKWNAYRLAENNEWKQIYTHTGDYCGSDVNSAKSQLYMCGIYQSDLTAIHLPDGAAVWNVKPGFNQTQRWFENITFSDPHLYISCAEGNIRGYDDTGNEVYKSETFANEVPSHSAITKNFAVSSFKDFFGSNKYLATFHNPGGLLVYTKFIQSDVVALCAAGSDKVLVFSNKNGHGDVSLYNGADNSLLQQISLSNGLIYDASFMDSNNYIVSSSTGLYNYQFSTNKLSGLVSKAINAKISCDNTTQRIFACYGKTMEVYSFPNASLLDTYNLPDSAVDMHIVFTK